MSRQPSSEVPDRSFPFSTSIEPGPSDTPERRLVFAVLLDAILQLRRGDAAVAVDAEQWIRDEIEDVPISFSLACEVLGFEAQNLARGLLAWRVAGPAGLDVPVHRNLSARNAV